MTDINFRRILFDAITNGIITEEQILDFIKYKKYIAKYSEFETYSQNKSLIEFMQKYHAK